METPATPPAVTTKLSKAEPGPTLADATDMQWHRTTIRIYPVTESQLEELTGGYNSLYLILFGIFSGASLTLGIALKQSVVAADKPYYFAGFLAALGLTAISGVAGFTKLLSAYRRKSSLYRESIPIEK
jgi:hypothetical protein